jgi:hypothetical protein
VVSIFTMAQITSWSIFAFSILMTSGCTILTLVYV